MDILITSKISHKIIEGKAKQGEEFPNVSEIPKSPDYFIVFVNYYNKQILKRPDVYHYQLNFGKKLN
ncbi:MAG TPA: hypothetical protein VMV49_07495 [Candidatus Deferrimicrobium sp.]|nr:hypothetical protein [Candidatus Deferrimicrobium sp.]